MRTLEVLAAMAEPWPSEKLDGLRTDIRGHLLKDWGQHVERRRGQEAVTRIRERTGISVDALPNQPIVDAWYPCRYQIALTDAIVQEYLGGDYLALEELLLEDATRKRERLVRWVAARVGPAAVFKRAPGGHRDMYSRGAVEAHVKRRQATMTWSGALLFENTTWQILQMTALRLMMRVMRRSLTRLEWTTHTAQSFQLDVAWR